MSDHEPEKTGARADLCRFLSACHYEPSPVFAEERMFDSMAEAAARIDPELAQSARRLGAAFAAQDLQSLLIDYTRLFLGPVNAPARPYGSVWLGGGQELMQESTMAVLALYRDGGFELADDFRELPDHVAAELEFLYVLLFRESLARRDGDAAALAKVTDLRRRFLDAHLARWIARFAAACRDNAQTGFYRELADITERFVSLEWQRLAAE